MKTTMDKRSQIERRMQTLQSNKQKTAGMAVKRKQKIIERKIHFYSCQREQARQSLNL